MIKDSGSAAAGLSTYTQLQRPPKAHGCFRQGMTSAK